MAPESRLNNNTIDARILRKPILHSTLPNNIVAIDHLRTQTLLTEMICRRHRIWSVIVNNNRNNNDNKGFAKH